MLVTASLLYATLVYEHSHRHVVLLGNEGNLSSFLFHLVAAVDDDFFV